MPTGRRKGANRDRAHRRKDFGIKGRAARQETTEGVFYSRVEEPDRAHGPVGTACSDHQVAATVLEGEWVWRCTLCGTVV